MLSECSGEIGQIIITTANSGGGDGLSLLDLLFGLCAADQVDGVDDGGAGIGLELSCEMEFADAGMLGNAFQCNGIGDVLTDIADGFFNIPTSVRKCRSCAGLRIFLAENAHQSQYGIANIGNGAQITVVGGGKGAVSIRNLLELLADGRIAQGALKGNVRYRNVVFQEKTVIDDQTLITDSAVASDAVEHISIDDIGIACLNGRLLAAALDIAGSVQTVQQLDVLVPVWLVVPLCLVIVGMEDEGKLLNVPNMIFITIVLHKNLYIARLC